MPAFAGMTTVAVVPRRSAAGASNGDDPAMKQPCVYILASRRNGTLYVGVTSDLVRRIWQHRNGAVQGFTRRYGIQWLVWYEQHETMESAIRREKALKQWHRQWKLRLIEAGNPQWLDLYETLL